MNPVMENLILEGFRDALVGRELATIDVMPIQPIDSRFDPENLEHNNPFPAAGIYLGDSQIIDENTTGLDVALSIRVDAILLQQSENLQYAYMIVAKHIMERIVYQRQRPNLQGEDRGRPFELPFVIDVIPDSTTTVARDAGAATQTFTRAFNFLVTYRTTYEEIQKYAAIR